VLKNKMSKEGVLQELKRRRAAEKPSVKKRRKHREALKRTRKSKGRARRLNQRRHRPRSKVVCSVPLPTREG
jgi:small subunit ribosomal protein S21